MAHTIENDHLVAQINPVGAELFSLRHKTRKVEYMWQADPAHWNRHAPVLFPFVGKSKNDSYKYDGQRYEMGQHGFARDMTFSVLENNESSARFLLKSNADSYKIYPFDFELIVGYQLIDSAITTSYQVSNPSASKLWFSIGGHPAFRCPLEDGKSRSDYTLQFSSEENTEIHFLTDGFFAGAKEPFQGNEIAITNDRFDKDALVFKGLRSETVLLVDNQGKRWLRFDFKGFPYLGIWSKSRTSPFVCIEPWFGLADHANHDGELTQKEGVLCLDPEEVFSCTYRVQVLPA